VKDGNYKPPDTFLNILEAEEGWGTPGRQNSFFPPKKKIKK
jgi:hypothetical protein